MRNDPIVAVVNCVEALSDILATIRSDSAWNELKANCSSDMIKYIQNALPLLMDVQFKVIRKYGFAPDNNGIFGCFVSRRYFYTRCLEPLDLVRLIYTLILLIMCNQTKGLKQFTNMIKELAAHDPHLSHLFEQFKAIVIPPLSLESS